MSPKIVLTGGGTAGHVTPNIAVIEALASEGWHIDYIGSIKGIEKEMITGLGIPYHGIHNGKLRRYFSWKNILDPFKILVGIAEAYGVLRRLRPQVVFSKGGFVAFPVVVAAWLLRIPIIAHESDMTPGLANRLSFPFVTKIALGFAAAEKHIHYKHKIEVTGTPIRPALLCGNKQQGLALCGFTLEKPCLLIMGGSQGAMVLNRIAREALPQLCKIYQVIHLCGKGKVDSSLQHLSGYCQFEYVTESLADLLAASEIVISRSGANALYELLVLKKWHVLVPLPASVSRGDQIQNARYFEQLGVSKVLPEEKLTTETLLTTIEEMVLQKDPILKKITALNIVSGTRAVVALIYAVKDRNRTVGDYRQ